MRVSSVSSVSYANINRMQRTKSDLGSNQSAITQSNPAYKGQKGALIGTVVGAVAGVAITVMTGGLAAGIPAGLYALVAGSYAIAGGTLGDKIEDDHNNNDNTNNKQFKA